MQILYIHAFMYTFAHACARACTHTHAHTCTRAHTHTHRQSIGRG